MPGQVSHLIETYTSCPWHTYKNSQVWMPSWWLCGGQIGARSYFGCCFQSVYSNHTRTTHTHAPNCTPPYFRDFHTYIAALNSPQHMSPEKRHWKTATDGATPLQPLSQAKLSLALPIPEARLTHLATGVRPKWLDHSLRMCLQILYSLIAMPSQHQHHAPP